jgi:hypothetical protein
MRWTEDQENACKAMWTEGRTDRGRDPVQQERRLREAATFEFEARPQTTDRQASDQIGTQADRPTNLPKGGN